jgi:hypothetical protein
MGCKYPRKKQMVAKHERKQYVKWREKIYIMGDLLRYNLDHTFFVHLHGEKYLHFIDNAHEVFLVLW